MLELKTLPVAALCAALTIHPTPTSAQAGNDTLADSMARALIAAGGSPGLSIAVARDGRVVFARGYGTANVELGVAADAATVYPIASITKQFTAAAVMRLIEVGAISLDDPLTKFLPDYPVQGHHVTIRHLLNHTSGIRSFTDVNLSVHRHREFRLDLTHDELLAIFAHQPFDFAPGSDYRYNNSGYYLLGEIVARVTGVPFALHLENEIVRPLGLDSTMACEHKRIVTNRAAGYEYENGELINAPPWNLAKFSPATGGLCSTAGDLVRWAHMLLSGRVVSASSLDLMTTRTTLADGRTVGYGFGLQLDELDGHRRISHGGGRPGAIAFVAAYPDSGITIAVLANSSNVGARTEAIEKALARAMLGVTPGAGARTLH